MKKNNKCPNLVIKPGGLYECRSTHVCYRSFCYDMGLFGRILKLNGRLIWK